MATLKEELNITEERYIEIKKMAYEYYEKYNSLERPYRRKFIEALPELKTQMETDILLCTLLFPDTSYLLSLEKGELLSALGKIAKNDDNITSHNVTMKAFEYSVFKTKELIQAGKLQIMDEISYPEDSISDREYIETKNSSLRIISRFHELSIGEKAQLVERACETDTYQARIQIATLLIPNDVLLMQQLKNNSVSEIAAYYKVPVSLIEFKRDEYLKQGTEMLISDGKLTHFKSQRAWYKDPLDASLISGIWDQSFYQSVENTGIERINKALEGLFNKPITKIIK